MLKRLWQWLKKLLRRLLGSQQIPVSPPVRETRRVEVPQLTDAEYESIFLRLLAGVNDEGWSRGRVKGFLDANCINEAALVRWLRGFGERLLASPTPNDELARRMVQLAVLNVGEVGDVAGEIGRRLQEGGERNHRDAEDTEEREMGEAEAWFNQRNEQLMAGDFAGALASYDKALKIQPDYYQAWNNRGSALANLEQYEQALASFDKAIEIQPNSYQAWNNRGSALANLEQYEQALASYDKALQIQPDFYQAWHNRGFAQGNLGQHEQALASYDKALQIQPDSYQAWYLRGIALDELGQYEQALASFDKAVEIQPDSYQTWYNRGNALADLGEYEQALASYDKALEIQPDSYQAWHNRGNALGNLGKYEQALASFDKALELKPDSYQAWYNRSLALSNLGQYEQAIASYNKTLEIQPDSYQAWYKRGSALADLGKYEQALASFDKALEIQPNDYEAWYNRGLALANLEQYEKAIASYDKALELKPDYCHAWNGRGAILCDHLQSYEEAIASFDKALKIQPDLYLAWYNRGVALGNLREYEQAIASYDKALQIQPDFYQAWLNRGIAARKSVSCNQLLAFSSAIARQNPHLNQRGYKGSLISYEEGLKYCQQDTHPEGWGILHQAIGNTHYLQVRRDFRTHSYWYKAVTSYNEALKTLTAEDFPELHLYVLQDLIRVHSDLGETAKAAELQRQGTDVLRRLLDEPHRSDKSKKQLALKFAWLRQLTVDLTVQSGKLLQAVELAEEGKNACLSWLLDGWSDEISSPSYSQMRQLLNPTTAIIYWHLSFYALHTFILKHDAPEPILLKESQLTEENGVIRQAQRLRDFEDWLKNWNQQYTDNRKGKKNEEAGTWRDNLPQMLSSLADILNIKAIVEAIPDIQQLILIPHRDLHRLPIHAIFPPQYTISYLPGAQIGINLQQLQPTNLKSIPESSLLSVEHPESIGYPSLEFAQIESQVISQMFPHPHRIRSQEVTKPALLNALPQGYNIFHFTGHGEYNFHNPALSFLALAGEDRLTLADIRNFDLTSYQLVSNFNLRSYQLVSLAACETAITGNQTITTEYVGLVSGFMACGVAHVLSTLWIVESEPSAVVMMRFYQLLQQGKSAAVALAETTQWLRNLTNAELAEWYAAEINNLPEGALRRFWLRRLENLKNQQKPDNQPYNHPYFWAAFTITGIFPS
ncbi:MAG TPA: tetratricopeptide repeat protein [Leptolyngbyaceae cyanobacterium]